MITEIARDVVKDIGYDQDGFSYYGADVEVLLHGQSPDIAMGVDAKKKKSGDEEGAGDQGMMFGFACTESEVYEKGSFMPAPIYFAHKILKVLSDKRRSGALFDLQPDAKSQVTVKYVDGKPVGCTKVVVSTQHNAQTRNGKKYTPGMVRELIADSVISALPEGWMPNKPSDFLVNPTGNFVVGGPDGDCGLTGRKIIVDTYGGYAPHGGGAFSGKDPTKVDRSAAYAARYLAKNVVAAGWRSAARSRSLMRSASPTRCRSWSIPTVPAKSKRRSCKSCCRNCFRCGRPIFAVPSISAGRSIGVPPLTAISAGRRIETAVFRGNAPTLPTRSSARCAEYQHRRQDALDASRPVRPGPAHDRVITKLWSDQAYTCPASHVLPAQPAHKWWNVQGSSRDGRRKRVRGGSWNSNSIDPARSSDAARATSCARIRRSCLKRYCRSWRSTYPAPLRPNCARCFRNRSLTFTRDRFRWRRIPDRTSP